MGSDLTIEHIEHQVKSFLLHCHEDGEMTISNLQKLASTIGVENSKNLHSKVDLIQKIQGALQHRSCFNSNNSEPCDESECGWRKECQKLIAVWYR